MAPGILGKITLQTVRAISVAAVLSILALTDSRPAGLLDAGENACGLGIAPVLNSNLRVNHAVLLDPSGVHLEFPGYVLGVEAPPFGPHRITHVVSYHDPPEPALPRTLFSLLDTNPKTAPGSSNPLNTILPCKGDHDLKADGVNDFQQYFREDLKNRLRRENFTHILVIVMGWKTDQQEAVKNYNQIAGNLTVASMRKPGELPFKPLIVGVSWDSTFTIGGEWLPLPPALVGDSSFVPKKDLAGEIGKRFLWAIIEDTILPTRVELHLPIPIIMIGHSFGARAFSTMLRSGKASSHIDNLYQRHNPSHWTFQDGDRLIMLQGAFDLADFFYDRMLVEGLKERHLKVTLTSSSFDTAVGAAIFAKYAGNTDSYDMVCGGKERRLSNVPIDDIACGDAIDKAHTPPLWGLKVCGRAAKRSDPRRYLDPSDKHIIHYLDASDLVNCSTPFGSGGAHDDFNRLEMGNFLWSEIASPWSPMMPPVDVR